MRGNRGGHRYAAGAAGSIPAYAGEPRADTGGLSPARVYPRVCGGTSVQTDTLAEDGGLSPRMRGNPPLEDGLMPPHGSIPAYAGEPIRPLVLESDPGVYPRVCGGTRCIRWHNRKHRGLSPRMRGNQARRQWATAPERSIPAYAGEPRQLARTRPGVTVYPRVCGGTPRSSRASTPAVGLSPRMRGNPTPRFCGKIFGGSIPAYAGEPAAKQESRIGRGVYPRVCGGTG